MTGQGCCRKGSDKLCARELTHRTHLQAARNETIDRALEVAAKERADLHGRLDKAIATLEQAEAEKRHAEGGSDGTAGSNGRRCGLCRGRAERADGA